MKGTLTAIAALMLLVGAFSACTNTTSPGTPSTTTPPAIAATAADLAFCVTETNRYRGMVARPALQQSVVIEIYAAAAARNDGTTHTPSGHTAVSNGGNGLVTAENEIQWQPFGAGSTVQGVMRTGLATFWNEGPNGVHYRNIVGAFTEMGCGVHIGNGEITIAQDFR
jgi:hypothetical protein